MTRREVFRILAAGAVGLILPPTKKFFVFGEGLWRPQRKLYVVNPELVRAWQEYYELCLWNPLFRVGRM